MPTPEASRGPDMQDEYDFSRATRANGPRFPDGSTITIDGATGYSIRLIPSNKVLSRSGTTRALWPTVVAAVDRGVPARCIVLDAHLADGSRYKVSVGRTLVEIAREGIGSPAQRVGSRVAS
jgi:hypothetical protein